MLEALERSRLGVGDTLTKTARHDLLKRPSAVKLLKPTRATDEMTARFSCCGIDAVNNQRAAPLKPANDG